MARKSEFDFAYLRCIFNSSDVLCQLYSIANSNRKKMLAAGVSVIKIATYPKETPTDYDYAT